MTVCLGAPVLVSEGLETDMKGSTCNLRALQECAGAPYFPVEVAQVQKFCD